MAYLICPILTTVLAFIILNEHLSTVQKTAIFLSLVSCLLLSIGHFMDLFYSFVIALSYALYLILQKKNNRLDKFFSLTIQIVLSTLLLLPLFSVSDASVEKGTLFYSLVALIAVLFTIVPLYLNTLALKGLDSSVVGILLYLNPILSFLLAVFYFGEHIETLQAISYSLIFISVLLFNSKAFKSVLKRQKVVN
ncbi:EamA family transporter [Olivibacter sitiensis]|uniref:EamA family transporter n=1 Tax=Olivibacter sitiensis TaxID=376470 RepID=UPI00041421B2|nr:EamA family transporter [Olivibacter sitiensis]